MPTFAVLWGNHAVHDRQSRRAWMADVWAKGITNFDLATAYAGTEEEFARRHLAALAPRAQKLAGRFSERTRLHAGTASGRNGNRCRKFIRANAARPFPSRRHKVMTTGAPPRSPAIVGQRGRLPVVSRNAPAITKMCSALDKGHVWPKDADGNWIEPFDPGFSGGQGGRDYTTENNGYTYDWDVQHDLQGLFELMGGRAPPKPNWTSFSAKRWA